MAFPSAAIAAPDATENDVIGAGTTLVSDSTDSGSTSKKKLPAALKGDTAIERLTKNYDVAQKELEEAQEKVDRIQEQVAELEAILPEQQARSDAGIKQRYIMQSNTLAMAEPLLSSETLEEFIRHVDYLLRISRANLEEFNKTRELKRQLDQAKEEEERLQAEAKEKAATAEAALIATQNDREEKQSKGQKKAQNEADTQSRTRSSATSSVDDEDDEDLRTRLDDEAEDEEDSRTYLDDEDEDLRAYLDENEDAEADDEELDEYEVRYDENGEPYFEKKESAGAGRAKSSDEEDATLSIDEEEDDIDLDDYEVYFDDDGELVIDEKKASRTSRSRSTSANSDVSDYDDEDDDIDLDDYEVLFDENGEPYVERKASSGSSSSSSSRSSTSSTTSTTRSEPIRSTEALEDGADWHASCEDFIAEWAPRLNAYLKGTPLSGQGANFAASAWKYCIDPRWSAAISNTESSKGRYCIRPHNAWGWGAADSDPYNLAAEWDSWEEAIDAHAAGLAKGYGYTITISGAQMYCPYNWENWYNNTLSEMAKI